MKQSEVCELIRETYTKDDYGVLRATESKRQVYCSVTSVTQTEWFEGGRQGLNPDKRATMFFFDYEGEEIVELNGTRYTVYRTYRDGDRLELYLEKRKGNADNPS